MAEQKVNLDEVIEAESLRKLRSMDAHAVVEWLKERGTWDYSRVPTWKLGMLEKHLAGAHSMRDELVEVCERIVNVHKHFNKMLAMKLPCKDILGAMDALMDSNVTYVEEAIAKAKEGKDG